MKDSKLIEILTTFSKEELRSFEKFIRSPYFTTGRDVTGLLSYLKKYYPQFEPAKMDRRNIFAALFPEEKYNEKKLKNINFDLTKLAEQFLIIESVKSDEIECQKRLTTQFKERDKEKLFLNNLNSLEKKLGKILIDDNYFEYQKKFYQLKEEYYLGKNMFEEAIKMREKITEYFILSFLVEFFKYLTEKDTINTIYGTHFKNILFDSICECIDFEKLLLLLKRENYSQLWVIEMSYFAYKFNVNQNDEESYKKYKKLYYNNTDKFSRAERFGIFRNLIFFCNINSIRKKRQYKLEEFEIYKEMLTQNSFSPSEKEYLHIGLYRNIMHCAISLKEYKWLENFARQYTPMVKPELRDNLKYLVHAKLDFQQGRFDDALENVSKIRYDVFIYKLDVRSLMLKIYYELDLFDSAFSMIDSFKHFLYENNELGKSLKRQYGNFVSVYNKLLMAKESGKIENLDILLQEIDSADEIESRLWLQRKVNELLNKVSSNNIR
jgi:hypothetical protein